MNQEEIPIGMIKLFWRNGSLITRPIGSALNGATIKGHRPYRYKLIFREDFTMDNITWKRITRWLNLQVNPSIIWEEEE